MVVVSDLVARVRAEGVQETAAQVKAVGVEAAQTARALEIMAGQWSKLHGGSAADAMQMFQRSGVQPTAAAMAEAAKSAERTSAAVVASVAPTQAMARATTEVGSGWTASESSLVRFGAALVGVNLGISLVAGTARLIHGAISDIVTTQLDWERSLKNLSGLYGEVGGRAAAFANAQANLPGVLGDQQEFAQAGINASALRLRYGLPQQAIDQLTTTGGRVAFSLGMTDSAGRAQLQAQLLAAVQTGAPLPAQYGIYTDPEAVSRRLGFQGGQALQAFTPQQVMTARQAIVTGGAAGFVDRANANRRAALETATAAEQAMLRARTNIQNALENSGGGGTQPVAGIVAAEDQSPYSALTRERRAALGLPDVAGPGGASGFVDYEGNARTLAATQATYAAALADSVKAQADASRAMDVLTHSVEGAGARLLSFFGSLEDPRSIARGDILAQAQGAVTARMRSAIPLIGQSAAEISAIAAGTSAQQAWQNFVAPLAQQEQTNVVRRNLERLASQSANPTPDRQSGGGATRTAAQRALEQMPFLDPINARINTAQNTGLLVEIQAADTQAKLEQISLTQRERYVQLMRETVDLRKLDVQQQQVGLAATMDVVRAQQSALPSQYALSNAQYQGNLASALAQQRMGRVLRGQSVAGLPSIDDLIQMNVSAQFATAEAGPAALIGARGIEMAQRTATSAGLAQQLTAGSIQSAELANDLKNLGDIPTQTGLQLELISNNRDQLAVQKELRDLTKDLVNVMKGRPANSAAPSDQSIQEIANRVGAIVFGDGSSDVAFPSPPDQPAARRPF